MDSDIRDILVKQSPIIVMLCVFLYFMYKYIMLKNGIIEKKDTIIIEQQNRLMELYGDAVKSQNRLSTVIEELRKDIERNRSGN